VAALRCDDECVFRVQGQWWDWRRSSRRTAAWRWDSVRSRKIIVGVLLVFCALAAPATVLAACPKVRLQLSAAELHQLINDEGGFKYYKTVTLADGSRAKRWVPYNDPVNCTVAHGHLIAYHKCTAAEIKQWTLTNAQADALLLHDAQSRVAAVNRLVTVGLTQAQFDALVDFVYNAGAGEPYYKKGKLITPTKGLVGSGILALVNAGKDKQAGEKITRYISRYERTKWPGLITRRQHEAVAFLKPSGECPPGGTPTLPKPVPKPKPTPTPAPTDPCAASPQPCFVQIEVNGYAPDEEEEEDWGVGIVTLSSATPQTTFAQQGGFDAGSWASQFDQDSGCDNGYDAVNECYDFEWAHSETVTLTAQPVPAGGYSANPTPRDESPSWDSTFAGWGGDCASAGMSPTCTLRLGEQLPTTGDAGQSGYSLHVTAYFEATEPDG
jgi:GH24 family phage-related lysozyme (muramidase)